MRVVPVAPGDDAAKLGGEFDGAYASPGALVRADLSLLGRALLLRLRPQAPVLLCLAGLSLRDIRERIGSGFLWCDAFALGVLLPGPSHAAWAVRNPQAFALLAVAERLARRWPGLRSRGRYLVVEAVRAGP